MTFLRDANGRIIGFDFGEPEELGRRQIRFARCERPFRPPDTDLFRTQHAAAIGRSIRLNPRRCSHTEEEVA